MNKLKGLEKNGRIDFGDLPVIETRTREILLKWLSNALEDSEWTARTDEGRRYVLKQENAGEKCVMHCEDGNLAYCGKSICLRYLMRKGRRR